MYRTTCPGCGAEDTLHVISFEAECSIPLSPDGFSALDAEHFSTSDEIVICTECRRRHALDELDLDNEDESGTDGQEDEPGFDEIVPVDGKSSIGAIGNYYGGLAVFAEGGRCYWGIEDHDGEYEWQEIPLSLYLALLAFERDTKARESESDTDGQEDERCS